MTGRIIFAACCLLSLLLLLASGFQWVPISFVEAIAFVTGAACVWLTAKENIWNWPIGIANSAFFLYLFLQQRLYADSALQILYIVLGFLGWHWWLWGGKEKTAMKVARIDLPHLIALPIATIAATAIMYFHLVNVKDSAPFLDALTTALSLTAQYMLTRKMLENWFVWITADIIYIGLYADRSLFLTALLYALFIALCVQGYVGWKRTLAVASST